MATPLTAATESVPLSVAPPKELLARLTTTVELSVVMTLPFWSLIETCTGGVMTLPTVVSVGCAVNTSWSVGPMMMMTPESVGRSAGDVADWPLAVVAVVFTVPLPIGLAALSCVVWLAFGSMLAAVTEPGLAGVAPDVSSVSVSALPRRGPVQRHGQELPIFQQFEPQAGRLLAAVLHTPGCRPTIELAAGLTTKIPTGGE